METDSTERGRGGLGEPATTPHGSRNGRDEPPIAGVHDDDFVKDEHAIPQSRFTVKSPNQSQAATASGDSAERSGDLIPHREIIETEQKTPGFNPSVADDASDVAHDGCTDHRDSSEASAKLNDTTPIEPTAESIQAGIEANMSGSESEDEIVVDLGDGDGNASHATLSGRAHKADLNDQPAAATKPNDATFFEQAAESIQTSIGGDASGSENDDKLEPESSGSGGDSSRAALSRAS